MLWCDGIPYETYVLPHHRKYRTTLRTMYEGRQYLASYMQEWNLLPEASENEVLAGMKDSVLSIEISSTSRTLVGSGESVEIYQVVIRVMKCSVRLAILLEITANLYVHRREIHHSKRGQARRQRRQRRQTAQATPYAQE